MPSAARRHGNLSLAAALAMSLSGQPASGATPSDELSLTRAGSIRSLISGCMAAIIDSSVIGYMRRAEQVGKPLASEAEARADMAGNPRWKAQMEPMIRTGCECSMKPEIDGIQAAQSVEAVQKIVFDLARRLGDPTTAVAEAAKFERCVQPLGPEVRREEVTVQ